MDWTRAAVSFYDCGIERGMEECEGRKTYHYTVMLEKNAEVKNEIFSTLVF